MAEPKFAFYERVRVVSANPELAEIAGATGAVIGRSDEENGCYEYGVFIESNGYCWTVAENDIETTGILLRRSDFYPL